MPPNTISLTVLCEDRKNMVDSWLGIPEAVVIDLYPSSLDPDCMDPARIELAAKSHRVCTAAV